MPEHVQSDPAVDERDWLAEVLDLRVGGLDSIGHMDWVDQPLAVGDEVTLRVLPPGPVDEPICRRSRGWERESDRPPAPGSHLSG